MLRQCVRLATVRRKQIKLAVAREEDRFAVRRPANDRNVATLGERQLRWAAADWLPPEMRDRASLLPVDLRNHVRQRPAVRRESERLEPLKFDDVDERHRPAALSRRRRAARAEGEGADNDRQGCTTDGHWTLAV